MDSLARAYILPEVTYVQITALCNEFYNENMGGGLWKHRKRSDSVFIYLV